jgi:two-component system nitrogen regulation sensor histidine kinase NtrY
LISLVRKYGLLILSICFAGIFSIQYFTVFQKDYSSEIATFQKNFNKTEKDLSIFLSKKKDTLEKEGLNHLIRAKNYDSFFFHIYRNDSLIHWNTNQLPILRFSDLHYPANGVIHLQNGWYYAKTIEVNQVQLVASFLIRKDYQYENRNLKNDFNPIFKIPFKGYISMERDSDYPIFKDNQFIFSLHPYDNQTVPSRDSDILIVLFLVTLSLFLLLAYRKMIRFSNSYFWLFTIGIVLLRYVSLKLEYLSILKEITAFQPTLYASSDWLPNFGELLINIAFILFFSNLIIYKLQKFIKDKKKSKTLKQYVLLFAYALVLVYSSFIWEISKGLVENSSIALEINKLFSLNFYSFLATISIGILVFSYFLLIRTIINGLIKTNFKWYWMLPVILTSSFIYLILEIYLHESTVFLSFWPLLINGLLVISGYKNNEKQPFTSGIAVLVLFSIYISLNLQEFNVTKEKQERELYANQLASDQDVNTEIEYMYLSKFIQEDAYLTNMAESQKLVGVAEFKDAMERKFFNNFWERYDIDFFMFNTKKEAVINYKDVPTSRIAYLETIINKHSATSEIDSNLFFIKDFTSQYSYIIRQPIFTQDSSKALLFCALKSKKIPEKIGFPRLLISNNAKVFESLENYSIAKYYNGKLVSRNGKFSYPSQDFTFPKNNLAVSGYFNNDGYNHYFLRRTQRDTIILSLPIPSTIQFFTSFSYLFSFYGLFLLIPIYLNLRHSVKIGKTLNLAIRIQVVLIGLVLVALVAFGLGSGLFVKNQYQEYSSDLIREKIHSVEMEIKQKFGEEEKLSIVNRGNYIEYLLQNLSTVFVTDINLYDVNGYLLASSRPKVYNIGLVSEQLNPTALFQLRNYSKSEFFHQEKIGNLEYLSGYIPFFNNEGNLLAYLNLQHFGQQKEFENQIQQFLVAIMNVFILLLALSITIAIFVSSWVTLPLRILQQNFAKVQFGKYNQPIPYLANDEIGILVKEYNNKLEELAYAAQQIAQSERESAWREMAKQVAHEIKNPLTPMKLNLQQLQRAFDPTDADAKSKINKVANSIIEQIDALAAIANEFSHFAKMPQANESIVDLIPLIEGAVLFFDDEGEAEITFQSTEEKCFVFVDKDLILRVLNNLIKNAMQAIPRDQKGEIKVRLSANQSLVAIDIKDNGIGISEEAQDKLFVPYFTTKSNGTGLGLAMVKQIIQMHQGKIRCVSSDAGTIFTIELPKSIKIIK